MPIPPQSQMIASPWGLMAAAPHTASSLLHNSHGPQTAGEGERSARNKDVPSTSAATSNKHKNQQLNHQQNHQQPHPVPVPAHSNKTNVQSLAASAISTMDAVMLQNTPGLIPGGKLPLAHSVNPNRPSPYLMANHIQPQPSSSSSRNPPRSSYRRGRHLHHQFGNSSQEIISLLHPKPPTVKSLLVLPPAPYHLFLDPSKHSFPVSATQLQASNSSGVPQAAHSSNPRKRTYPFDNLSGPAGTGASGSFPSPDTILDRIKSSAIIPEHQTSHRSSSSHASASSSLSSPQRQQYDSPRDIFRHTAQSFAAAGNPNVFPGSTPPLKKAMPSSYPSNSSSNRQRPSSSLSSSSSSSTSKSKSQMRSTGSSNTNNSSSNSSKHSASSQNSHVLLGQSAKSPYGMAIPGLELQIPTNGAGLDPTTAAFAAAYGKSGVTSVHEQMMKMPSSSLASNGYLSAVAAEQSGLVKGLGLLPHHLATPENSVASGKDGRLSSALFGVQFNAMPRVRL